MELVYYVSIIAQLLTYASFLSGAKVCHLIHKQKSCAKLSPMPFLAGLNCAALWLRYGFLANEWEIITVNCVGLAFSLVYLAFFVVYSKQKSRLANQLLILLAFLALLLSSIEFVGGEKLFLAGSLASMASLIACASPLATIQDVLKTKCVASLPFPIIASSFVVSLSWLTFGYLKGDEFIVFSNLVALAISGSQLSLFALYPSMHPYEKLSPSNKKSYDLIRLLNSEDDHDDDGGDQDNKRNAAVTDSFSDANNDEIDTNQDYKETLAKICSRIYSERERSTSKKPAANITLLLCAA